MILPNLGKELIGGGSYRFHQGGLVNENAAIHDAFLLRRICGKVNDCDTRSDATRFDCQVPTILETRKPDVGHQKMDIRIGQDDFRSMLCRCAFYHVEAKFGESVGDFHTYQPFVLYDENLTCFRNFHEAPASGRKNPIRSETVCDADSFLRKSKNEKSSI
jgi:hypothetical protein